MKKIGHILLIAIVLGMPTYGQTDGLLNRFIAEPDEAKKEQLLNQAVRLPDVGSKLLSVAMRTNDILTKWMSIRGIGMVKYQKAVPFLIDSLNHQHPYVRANAARALGEIGDRSVSSRLIQLLGHERDAGVVEQTSLALRMLGAREAVPTLERAATHPSGQTRCWVLQAIGTLGGKKEVPFLAQYLYGSNEIVNMCAAQAVEEITGEDFGFPGRSGPMSPHQGIERAREWWEKNKISFSTIK
jgi:HEAT repeat protein